MIGHYMINWDGQNKSKYTWVRKVIHLKLINQYPLLCPDSKIWYDSGSRKHQNLLGLETKLGLAGRELHDGKGQRLTLNKIYFCPEQLYNRTIYHTTFVFTGWV